MKNVKLLDCTLRDGGYCNKWQFGKKGILEILNALYQAKVEIIECGFITNSVDYNENTSKYTDIHQVDALIDEAKCESSKLVVMMNYGDYNVDLLPPCADTVVDGIRVAFHKKDRYLALQLCQRILNKGYDVFIQPMVTMQYSDDEFVELIEMANEIMPYAFYIVDSFGTMNSSDLKHFYDLVNWKLSKTIQIGFHSHNNLQSAFSNALYMLGLENDKHTIIVDCSIYGMGRGAGNLNTELFINELNQRHDKYYGLKPILIVMDEIINRFYEEKPWGYSLPNYLSAIHMIHPNYATYLSEKNTLSIADMDAIFSMMDADKANEYDREYISELYISYMSTGRTRKEHLNEVKKVADGRDVLLIAPGRTAIDEKERILDFIEKKNPIVISINHEYTECLVDFIFVSNKRRFGQLSTQVYQKTISTSNINTFDTFVSVDYDELLNSEDDVRDNAGLMAIKFVADVLKKKRVYIAGLDGYSHDAFSNFESKDMAILVSNMQFDQMNNGMINVIHNFRQTIEVEFITKTILG